MLKHSDRFASASSSLEGRFIRLAYVEPKYRPLILPYFKLKLANDESLRKRFNNEVFDLGKRKDLRITTVLNYSYDSSSPVHREAKRLVRELQQRMVRERAKKQAEKFKPSVTEKIRDGVNALGRKAFRQAGYGIEAVADKFDFGNPIGSFLKTADKTMKVGVEMGGLLGSELYGKLWDYVKDTKVADEKRFKDYVTCGAKVMAKSGAALVGAAGVLAGQTAGFFASAAVGSVAGAVTGSGVALGNLAGFGINKIGKVFEWVGKEPGSGKTASDRKKELAERLKTTILDMLSSIDPTTVEALEQYVDLEGNFREDLFEKDLDKASEEMKKNLIKSFTEIKKEYGADKDDDDEGDDDDDDDEGDDDTESSKKDSDVLFSAKTASF
jgi:hypothetical protein